MSFEVPEVSIIIPLYNAEKYVEHTLMSLSQQTFTDFEAIIVDDCSTDDSVKIVQEFQQTEELKDKIKLVKLEKNGGISSTRNVGLRMSRGKYIMFVDDDDFLIPTSVDTLVAMARKYNAEVVHTHSHYQNNKAIDEHDTDLNFAPYSFEQGNKDNLKSPPHALTNDMTERVDNLSTYKLDWNVWGKLFDRDFLMLNNIHFPKIPYTEDLLFCFQCLMYTKRYIMIPDLLYVYRYRSSSTLHKERGKNFLKKVIDTQVIGLKLLNEYMDTVKHFETHERDRNKIINFYMKLEMLSTKVMQKKFFRDVTYYKSLQDMYAEHFGKDDALIAYLHMLANG